VPGKIFEGIKDVGSFIWDGIKSVASVPGKIFEGIKDVGSLIWDGIKGIASVTGKIFEGIKDAGSFILDSVKTVASIPGKIINEVKETVKGSWDFIKEIGNGIHSGLEKTVNTASKAVSVFTDAFSAITSPIKDIGGTIKDVITSLSNGVKAIAEPFTKIAQALTTIIEKIPSLPDLGKIPFIGGLFNGSKENPIESRSLDKQKNVDENTSLVKSLIKDNGMISLNKLTGEGKSDAAVKFSKEVGSDWTNASHLHNDVFNDINHNLSAA
jgi:phage-related protein